MSYLMQLYAPIDEIDEAYHRVLYVFYCSNIKCQKSKREVKVLRAQCNESQELYSNKIESTKKQSEPLVEAKGEGVKEEIEKLEVQDKEVKKEKKSKSKKKKREQEQRAYGIEVISEKSEVTEQYAKQIDQLLAGKKLLSTNEEEIKINKEEDKHLKELIRNYEEAQGELSIEDKKALDVCWLVK
jgi:pre-rRNA-processing protein TSR4